MRMAKKYTHTVTRTDFPDKTIKCTSLNEAKDVAVTMSKLSHYKDNPGYDISDRSGRVVASLFDGVLRESM